jgi:uncharacterized membrane protein (UPF0127 family)
MTLTSVAVVMVRSLSDDRHVGNYARRTVPWRTTPCDRGEEEAVELDVVVAKAVTATAMGAGRLHCKHRKTRGGSSDGS